MARASSRVAMPLVAAVLLQSAGLGAAVCDGNPHEWNRVRRCDQYDARCPDADWALNCSLCEGIGGLASSDSDKDFTPVRCEPVASAAEMKRRGVKPVLPVWPETFVNTGFHEVQIFVKRDPFCLAQIPAMVSNGTHCYKRQEGTFNYDARQSSLRIDYLRSSTVILPHVNMTEHFYHLADGTVHPSITKYGPLPSAICPCIALGIGPVAYYWARDAEFVGRERLDIEFLGSGGDGASTRTMVVDHFVKGPHHVWSDTVSGNVVRLWQPFNGLEIFDPEKYNVSDSPLPAGDFKLPLQCRLEEKLGCINATGGAVRL